MLLGLDETSTNRRFLIFYNSRMSLRRIYLITLVEGFATLAIQMIVLRLAIPVVGSSIVLTSIFLGVILLALSCGYRYGGILAEKYKVESITSKGALGHHESSEAERGDPYTSNGLLRSSQ